MNSSLASHRLQVLERGLQHIQNTFAGNTTADKVEAESIYILPLLIVKNEGIFLEQ